MRAFSLNKDYGLAYRFPVANDFTRALFSDAFTTFTFTLFRISPAAFFASLFVGYSPFSSIHGKVSSILIHVVYNSFSPAFELGTDLELE